MSENPTESNTDEMRPGRPRVAITLGDPAGIGPEIVVKALLDSSLNASADLLLVGNERVIRQAAKKYGVSSLASKGKDSSSSVSIVDPGDIDFDVSPGDESAQSGLASARCIETAVQMWQNGAVDAIATAPISKNALSLAGYAFPGHTEFLAELTGTKRFAMSFFADELRVVLLSTHCSLLEAIARVKRDALIDLIKFSDEQLRTLLGREITIAVAGLNPHASEGGMFGREEADEVKPAIDFCRTELGIAVSGPYSPDTIFLRGHRGEFDAVLACYHDQATIAVKSLAFGSAVNVTLGLPLVRTSVDHGTAFDIAGKDVADASSMAAAIRLAVELVNGPRRHFSAG